MARIEPTAGRGHEPHSGSVMPGSLVVRVQLWSLKSADLVNIDITASHYTDRVAFPDHDGEAWQ
jgi:hypothetical protein